MKTTISLRKRIFATIITSLFVFLLAEFGFLMVNKHQQDAETLLYVDEALSNTVQKLKDMDMRLRLLSGNLSVHTVLAKVVALRPSVPVDNESIYRAFEVIRLALNASNEIVDIALVNQDGLARSYVTGWAYSFVPYLSRLYDFSNSGESEPEYFFLPQGSQDGLRLFFLVVPLWNMRTDNYFVTKPGTRVGSIVIACDLDAMIDMINYGFFRPYKISILSGRGQEVIAQFANKAYQKDIVRSHYIENLDITIQFEGEENKFYLSSVFIASVVLILLFILISQLMLNRLMKATVLRPLDSLSDDMLSIRRRPKGTRLSSLGIKELDPIVDSANNMLNALDEEGKRTTKVKLDLLEAQLHRNEAERYALQSQINPHFLFNSLQCIRALAIAHQADDVASVTNALADLMRYAISAGDKITLGDEVAIIRKYLGIIDIRYQRRISYWIDVPEELLRVECIKMLIQPLVENAVTHGLSMVAQGGEIRITAKLIGEDTIVEVQDNGCGMEPVTLQELNQMLNMDFLELLKESKYRSYGLYNIHRRMQIAYGGEYGLSIDSKPGRTRLTVKFPVRYLQ